jgi:hypothetical protein
MKWKVLLPMLITTLVANGNPLNFKDILLIQKFMLSYSGFCFGTTDLLGYNIIKKAGLIANGIDPRDFVVYSDIENYYYYERNLTFEI